VRGASARPGRDAGTLAATQAPVERTRTPAARERPDSNATRTTGNAAVTPRIAERSQERRSRNQQDIPIPLWPDCGFPPASRGFDKPGAAAHDESTERIAASGLAGSKYPGENTSMKSTNYIANTNIYDHLLM
jgi:hypothetical protein